MPDQVERAGLQVRQSFARFVEAELLPGSGLMIDQLWRGLALFRPEEPRPDPRPMLDPALWVEHLSARSVIENLSKRYVVMPQTQVRRLLDALAPLQTGSWEEAEDLRLHRKQIEVSGGGRLQEASLFKGSRAEGSRFFYHFERDGLRFEVISDFLSPQSDALGADFLQVEAIREVVFQAGADFETRLEEMRVILSFACDDLALPKEKLRLAPDTAFLGRNGKGFRVPRRAGAVWQVGGAFDGAVRGMPAEVLELLAIGIIAKKTDRVLRFVGTGRGLAQIVSLLSLDKKQLVPVEVPKLWANPESAASAILHPYLCADAALKTAQG